MLPILEYRYDTKLCSCWSVESISRGGMVDCMPRSGPFMHSARALIELSPGQATLIMPCISEARNNLRQTLTLRSQPKPGKDPNELTKRTRTPRETVIIPVP
ncbi:unnamed protein product [Tuber aestivum]|uniref:Uncharacterized protein n=1 Tax=Tuber aestivum TaxID=59557 RepID=A0A292Q1D8_9PEZI|nr:unnamed protein product [Tuber aestivum]